MLTVESDHTKKQEPCTMQLGVVGVDGVRRGAIPDIDCYAMFGWEDGAGREVDIVEEYKRERVSRCKPQQLGPPTDDELEHMAMLAELEIPLSRD
jgi:hypothetical protein